MSRFLCLAYVAHIVARVSCEGGAVIAVVPCCSPLSPGHRGSLGPWGAAPCLLMSSGWEVYRNASRIGRRFTDCTCGGCFPLPNCEWSCRCSAGQGQ